MNRITSLISIFLLIGACFATAQDEPIRIDFSGDTAAENNLTVMGPGFGAYPQGQISFGSIPTDGAFNGATDGRGAIITAGPNEGVMVFGPAIPTDRSGVIRCNFYADGPEAAITVAAVDQGPDLYVVTSSPSNGAVFDHQYQRITAQYSPPTVGFQPLFQIHNPSERTITVYVDNFDVYLIDPERCYNGEFLDHDEIDPDTISADLEDNISPTLPPDPTIPPNPTPTTTINGWFMLYGTVTSSADGAPIAGADVIVFDQTITTDESGSFFHDINVGVPEPSTFTVRVEKEGFEPFEQEYPFVNSQFLNITLTPGEGTEPTPPPQDTAAGLRLTVCDPVSPISVQSEFDFMYTGGMNVIVDLIDANGRIVNPGTEGGAAERTVTVSVTGSAQFEYGAQSMNVQVDSPDGGMITLYDSTAEEVTISASTPGLTDAAPVNVQFIPAGSISGLIQVWDGEEFTAPLFTTVDATVYVAGTMELVFDVQFIMDTSGEYTITGLASGTYDIQFKPMEPMDFPDIPDIPDFPDIPDISDLFGNSTMSDEDTIYLQTVCVPGISVTAPGDTPNVNVDLGPRENGAHVYGSLVREDGEPVDFIYATVVLYSQDAQTGCEQMEWIESIISFGDDLSDEEDPYSLSYELNQIPAGTYLVRCTALSGETQFANGAGELITLAPGEDKEVNLIMKAAISMTLESPVDYPRISPPFSFVWSVPEDAPAMIYDVYLTDRCGVEIWSQTDITGTEAAYTGPALSNQTIYSWYVLSRTEDEENTGGVLNFGYSAAPEFLVE